MTKNVEELIANIKKRYPSKVVSEIIIQKETKRDYTSCLDRQLREVFDTESIVRGISIITNPVELLEIAKKAGGNKNLKNKIAVKSKFRPDMD
jgi:hypothetical protein